jgi:hypothetical protein
MRDWRTNGKRNQLVARRKITGADYFFFPCGAWNPIRLNRQQTASDQWVPIPVNVFVVTMKTLKMSVLWASYPTDRLIRQIALLPFIFFMSFMVKISYKHCAASAPCSM